VSNRSQKNFTDLNIYYKSLITVLLSTSYRIYVALKEILKKYRADLRIVDLQDNLTPPKHTDTANILLEKIYGIYG
jgi:hypothetical protein